MHSKVRVRMKYPKQIIQHFSPNPWPKYGYRYNVCNETVSVTGHRNNKKLNEVRKKITRCQKLLNVMKKFCNDKYVLLRPK